MPHRRPGITIFISPAKDPGYDSKEWRGDYCQGDMKEVLEQAASFTRFGNLRSSTITQCDEPWDYLNLLDGLDDLGIDTSWTRDVERYSREVDDIASIVFDACADAVIDEKIGHKSAKKLADKLISKLAHAIHGTPEDWTLEQIAHSDQWNDMLSDKG